MPTPPDIALAGTEPPETAPKRRRDPWWTWVGLIVIALVAGAGYAYKADSDGVEAYYAGAVRTMSQSWHAFFFGGFDPAGNLTLDKLPGTFWLQALTVRAFGVHTWCFVAPQIAAGFLLVIMVFVAVRRIVGPRTGLLAALATAAMPATAVLSRGNTADPLAVLLMVVAADAVIRAIRNGRLRSLIVAGIWIGLAFQAKMIEAWTVVPALALAYLISAPGSFAVRLRRFTVAGVVMVIVSLSWMTAVSLVPANDRPWVDGSPKDSVFQQVFVYNGFTRFSQHGGYGLAAGLPYQPTPDALAYTRAERARLTVEASQSVPGPWRLITGPIGRDVGWLLPAALAIFVALLIALRRAPRTDPIRAGVLLWGGWLITFTVVFSRTVELQSYYLGVLVPPVAALFAIGVRTIYRAGLSGRRRSVVGASAATVVLLLGLGLDALLTKDAPRWLGALVLGVAVLGLTGAVVGFAGNTRVRRIGAVVAAFALLAAPATVAGAFVAARGSSFDAPLAPTGTAAEPIPAAGSPTAIRVPIYGGVVLGHLDAYEWGELVGLAEVEADRLAGRRILIFTSAEASIYVLAGVPNVEPIGGYTGLIGWPDVDQLRAEITSHEIKWAIVPGDGDIRSADPRVALIKQLCFTDSSTADAISFGAQVYDCDEES